MSLLFPYYTLSFLTKHVKQLYIPLLNAQKGQTFCPLLNVFRTPNGYILILKIKAIPLPA